MFKKLLEDNYKYFKLDKSSDSSIKDKNIENFAISMETKKNPHSGEGRDAVLKMNKELSDRLDSLKAKKDIINNRNKVFLESKNKKETRRKQIEDDAKKFQDDFNKKIKEANSNYGLKHSFEFRKRDSQESAHDQINPNLSFDFYNVQFDQNEGAIFNGINGYAVSREELPAQKEITIEIFIKLIKPKSEKGSTIFAFKSKENLSAINYLGHLNKTHTKTPQGYNGKTKESQAFFLFNNTGMTSENLNPSDPMADGINIDSDTHIVLSCNKDGQVKYYKNGNLIFSKNTNKKYIEIPQKLFLGINTSKEKDYKPEFKNVTYPIMNFRYFRIYDKVLDTNQIKNIYNNANNISYIDDILNIKKQSLIKLSASKKEDGKFAEKDDFNKELRKQELPFYLLYMNPGFGATDMQTIVYKRLTSIEDVDMFTLLHIDWFDAEKGIKNTFNVDFELYSDIESAVSSTNRWKFCNFNASGVGFMRDCGKTSHVGGHWISITRDRGYNWKNWSFNLYKLSERQKLSQNLKKSIDELQIIKKQNENKEIYNLKGLIQPIRLSTSRKDGDYQEPEKYNEYLKALPIPFYLIWENPIAPNDKYKNIIYKRLTSVDDVDMYDLFHNNWFDHNKGVKNEFNKDFELYSDINHALDQKRIKKIKIVNNGHLEILEIQVWINGVNVAQNTGTYAIATPPHENSVAVSKNAFNNVIEHGNEVNERWKKVYFSQNMNGSFFTLELDRTYPFEDLQSIIIYNVKWSDDIRFTQSYTVLLDADDNEITDKISNNNGDTAYHYYKYNGPSHDKNTKQSDVPSTEKMLSNNMQKLIKKDISLKKLRWKFCNFNSPGTGFPRDCGTHGAVGGMWMSTTQNRAFGWQKWSISVTVNKYQYEQRLFNELKEITDEESKLQSEIKKAEDTNIENKKIIEKRNDEIKKTKSQLRLSMIVNGVNLAQLTEDEINNLKKYVKSELIKDLNLKNDKNLTINLFSGSIGVDIILNTNNVNDMKDKLDKFEKKFKNDKKLLEKIQEITGITNLTSFTKVVQAGLDKKSTKPDPKNYDCHIRLPIFSKKFVGTFAFKSNTITEIRAICPNLFVNRKYIDLGKFNSPGGNIGEYEDTEWQYCPKRCNEIKGCVGYVKDLTNENERKGCTFKNIIDPSKMSESTKHRTYLVKNNYELIGKEDYKGNDIGVLHQVDTSVCPTLCDKTPNCVGFVENTIDKKGCYLKSKFGKRTSDGKKTSYQKSNEYYEEIPFSKKPITAGDVIWLNRNGTQGYKNPNGEKFTFTKLDNSIESTWSSKINYGIETINTRGIELFINNLSDDDEFYIIVDTTKDTNGLYINDGGLIGQLEVLGYTSLGDDAVYWDKGPFRTYKLKLKSSNKINEYQKDPLFNKKNYFFNEIKIQQSKLSNIIVSELQIWVKGKNIVQEKGVFIQGTFPMYPKSLVYNIVNKKLDGKKENSYNSSFFEDSYLLIKLNNSFNFNDLEAVVVYIPKEEKEKYADNYIVLLDEKGNEMTERISNFSENQKYEQFIYKGPAYGKNENKSNTPSNDKLLNEEKNSDIRTSSSFVIKDSIPLNNYISQSERFGEKNFGTRVFLYNQYKNKIFYNMIVREVVDGISYVPDGYNIITRLDNNELFLNEIEYFYEKDKQFYIGVKKDMPIPYGPLYQCYICGPNDPLCYPTPCRGEYTECNESCEKTYKQTSKAALGGLECTIEDGSVEKCEPGEGQCKSSNTVLIISIVIGILLIIGIVYFLMFNN